MEKNWNEARILSLIYDLIQEYEVNLEGLTVFTEAATGPYFFTPFIPALAEARKIYAIAKDSSYGKAKTIRKQAKRFARNLGLEDKLVVVMDNSEEFIRRSDIITNSGFVRPITSEMIDWMKPTAVIPLMWETWEYRDNDLDLEACKRKGILVLGTNEHESPCNMKPYSGLLGIKLIFELGLEGYKSNILLIGGQPTLGEAIYKCLISIGTRVDWFSSINAAAQNYKQLPVKFEEIGAKYEAIIIAEHQDPRLILGTGGLLTFDRILAINPHIRIGIISGNINIKELKFSGLNHFPAVIRPFGYMSYQPEALGPRPILELYTAGIKVGEAMARARISGLSVGESTQYVLKNSPAMDFPA